MGPVMVDRMPEVTLGSEPKKLHPFFSASKSNQRDAKPADTTTPTTNPTPAPDPNEAQEKKDEADVPEENSRNRKRRKAAEEVDDDFEDTKKPRRGRKKNKPPQGGSITNHFVRLDGGDQPKEDGKSDEPPQIPKADQSTVPPPVLPQTPESVPNADVALPQKMDSNAVTVEPATAPAPEPKKFLRLNPKTGTIGSPPKPKQRKEPEEIVDEKATSKPKRKTRNSKIGQEEIKKEPDDVEKTPTPKRKRRSTRIARVSYGSDDESRKRIGGQIDEVLSGGSVTPSPKRKRASPKGAKGAKQTKLKGTVSAAGKATHPLFTKAKKEDMPAVSKTVVTKPSAASKQFSSTPCSPKKPRTTASSVHLPQFGVKSLGLRVPGAKHPAWPCKDMVHVRGDESESFSINKDVLIRVNARKSKGNGVDIGQNESIMNLFTVGLSISAALDVVRNIDTEICLPPPPELRLPQKQFESGVKLGKRMVCELRTVTPQSRGGKLFKLDKRPSGGPELEQYIEKCTVPAPEVARLYSAMTTSLSALDKSTCESMSWAQKYTPSCAVEVLQSGKEAFLLRDWLQALKVQSVYSGAGDGDAPKSKSKGKSGKNTPPRKKRKRNKLDGFVVDSDEEANEMAELSDLEEENWSPRGRTKKTVIRSGDAAGKDSKKALRLTNAVVISGPHGCGKTSAVYAVAKELDFEIFEINSTTRRSGKDVLEKIGDMTRNHLVQHHQKDTPAVDVIDEEEVAEDIKSGKQATMNSFFKPKSALKASKATKTAKNDTPPKQPESKKAPPKSQKQSLILLDEIDILYEEDKQFWATVIGLMVQSKRPFIMTCNDENLVPLQTLSLYGIFRFSAPPTELAVDRLLMVAACEGHALRRDAVEALYEARHQDFRACLMELNYWCQIGVGDRRGGFDWFVSRWPKGVDLDENGNVVRVVSQNTYLEGQGWLAHDILAEETDPQRAEEELMQEAWDYWQIDVGNWHESLDLTSWAQGLASTTSTRQDQLSSLERYEEFADAMGSADLCSSMAFAPANEEPIDYGLPDMPVKARDDYIVGLQVLDAPMASSYDPMLASVPISLRSLARQHLRAAGGTNASDLDALDESKVIASIRKQASRSPEMSAITRADFGLAFDPIAISEKSSATANLDPSVLDGTMDSMVVDVAPYVRSIVAYDNELQKQRLKMSNLLSEGGKGRPKKRMRNTRASHAALEGGSRSTTRADRWFKADLNSHLVMHTAGDGWVEAVKQGQDSSSDGSAQKDRSKRRKILSDDSADELGGDSPSRSLSAESED